MSRDVNMTAAFEEGIKARESHYSKYSNPYLVSHLRAAWNRGWDSGEPIPGQDQAQTEDTHGHTWDLAESLGELVRGEVAKILGRELGPAWMKRIEALEARVANGEVQAIDHVAQERIDANREWLESIEGRTYSRIRNLQQSSIDTKQELATINQRIADVETTLERLEGGLDAESEETDSYVTAEDCDKMRWPEGLNTEYLNQVPKEVREVAVDAAMKFLDDNVEWVGEPPAAGPWKEGLPPDDDMNKWLVIWGKQVFMLEETDDNLGNITHHARIYKPEATDD